MWPRPASSRVIEEWLEIGPARFMNRRWRALVNPDPGIDKSTDEPRPDRALMICAIAFAHAV
jgi:hypothetical protein